ncbi:MAG TPA: hypothetical protein VJZ27_06285, partial [Aggregatilineales bacterium]|nr:hypothetical protein [Aggregatilineales bacterium]
RVDPIPAEQFTGSSGGEITVPGQSVRGGLTESDLVDQWTFEAEAGENLEILVVNRRNNERLELTVREPGGGIIDTASYVTASENNRLLLENLPVMRSGIYQVDVSLTSVVTVETTIYSLRISRSAPDYRLLLHEASSTGINTTAAGKTLSPNRKTDAWVFYGEAGESIALSASPGEHLSLTLINPEGQPIAAGTRGSIDPLILLNEGFYGVIVSSNASSETIDYELNIQTASPRSTFRWTLNPGDAVRASLSPGAALHEWELVNYGTG